MKNNHKFGFKLQHKMANDNHKAMVYPYQLNFDVYFWREKLDATYAGIIFYSGEYGTHVDHFTTNSAVTEQPQIAEILDK